MNAFEGVYLLRVYKDRRLPAVKDVILGGLGRILAWCAGSDWTIQTPGFMPKLTEVARRSYPSRDLIMWGSVPEDHVGRVMWDQVKLIETRFKPPFPAVPSRPFAFPCRGLCGLDLHRPHLTCVTFCRIRRGFYGQLPLVAELLAVWQIALLHQHFRRNGLLKDKLFKRISVLAEVFSN